MTNGNPYLVLGCDISAYLAGLRNKKIRLATDEFCCMHCRTSRKALGGMADFAATSDQLGVLQALCEVCGQPMSRGADSRDLPRLRTLLDIKG